MKQIRFHGSSLSTIRKFPSAARREAGHQLDRIQRGLEPQDWKPMSRIGKGVKEIRVRDNGQFRVVYLAVLGDMVHVLHAFRKKSQKTSLLDIRAAQKAFGHVRMMHD